MKKVYLVCNSHIDPTWQWDWDEGAAAALATANETASMALAPYLDLSEVPSNSIIVLSIKACSRDDSPIRAGAMISFIPP